MATRSRIGIKNQDGTVTSIYCHWDGYLEHVGEILAKHYRDENKVRALMVLGNASSLGESIEQPEGHTFGKPTEGCTVFYGRDRGESDQHAVTHSMALWPDYGQEFEYLFEGGVWKYLKGKAWAEVPGQEPVAKNLPTFEQFIGKAIRDFAKANDLTFEELIKEWSKEPA